ncbi:hypothetical protein RB653_006409 [Dictyostelium firmibasis]|uniref:Beta-lactamase-related domain-containing protein n=1 Tax=Dictyostelium firmibasis TaxID=79012 RepID=A0AAN7U9M7_9MYCE
MTKNYIIYILILFTFFNLFKSCPTYPKPVKINQNDPLLLKTYNEIDLMIQNKMKLNNISSFLATIVYMDEIVFSKAYGNVNPLDENSPELTVDNNIRIASITKTFTSLMMFKLRDQGIINSLDDDIRDYFPQFKINSIYKDKRNEKVTFRQLASHQSGLARETPCERIDYGTKNCNDKTILSKLSKQFLISKQPNILSHYSNLGYSLLGRVLGESLNIKTMKEQEAYEYWVVNNIFKPLGMENTTFNYDEIKENMAVGLYKNNNGSFSEAPITPSGWNSPGGGIFSTLRDMSKFLIFLLSDENQQENQSSFYLEESTLNELFSPSNLLRDGVSVYGIPFLHTYDSSNSIWISAKNGDLTGYHSNMAFVRPLKLGLFFSSLSDISSPDIYINSSIDLLVPVYEILLNEASSSNENEQNLWETNITPIIPNSFLVGNYIDLYGNEFIIYNQTFNGDYNNGNLLVNFDNSITNLTIHTFELDKDFPYIKRISYSDQTTQGCRALAGGENEELIYFDFENIDKNEEFVDFNDITKLKVYSVQVMGILLYKL